LILARIASDLLRADRSDPAGIDGFFDLDADMVAGKNGVWLPTLRIETGKRALALGLRGQAGDIAAMARETIETTGERYSLSDLERLNAALANVDGNGEAAEQHLQTALDVAWQQGAELYELRAAIDLASLWRDQGKIAKAISLLQPVHDSIAEGGCPDDRATAHELLAALAG
jgi:hypothetical protein